MAEQYYMVVDKKTVGPFSLEEIKLHQRLAPDTLVWKPGLDNWIAARELPELDMSLRAGNHNPDNFGEAYNPGHPPFNTSQTGYNPNRGYNPPPHYDHMQGNYGGNYRHTNPTNWLPWAIVATVFGFFTSCIGVIFGIIGIVQANKANSFYARGWDREGDSANSNAKIMTIIGLVLAGIGLFMLLFIFGTATPFLSYY